MMFSPLSTPVELHRSVISIYISFLDLTYNHNWSHLVIEEHSDVPVYQTSRMFSQILYIQSIIGVLYSTVAYVWAQDITWDWMWCSSYCRRKKSLIVIVQFVIFISYDFLRYLFYFVTFYICFESIYLGYLPTITNKMLFTCFFGEPMLKYDIVTVCFFYF